MPPTYAAASPASPAAGFQAGHYDPGPMSPGTAMGLDQEENRTPPSHQARDEVERVEGRASGGEEAKWWEGRVSPGEAKADLGATREEDHGHVNPSYSPLTSGLLPEKRGGWGGRAPRRQEGELPPMAFLSAKLRPPPAYSR